jgi:hypothetical protein
VLRRLAGLPEKHGNLAEVEIHKVLALVHDIGAELSPYDTLPRGTVLLIELAFDVRGDVFFHLMLLDGLGGHLHSVILHIVANVRELDVWFALSHV